MNFSFYRDPSESLPGPVLLSGPNNLYFATLSGPQVPLMLRSTKSPDKGTNVQMYVST